MKQRLNYYSAAPEAMKILIEQETYLGREFTESEVLTPAMLELIKLRVSQINQCAFCVDKHSKDALNKGEKVERLISLSAWKDTPIYTDHERAALKFAEMLTAGGPLTDQDYDAVEAFFSGSDLVNLTIAINAINSWNRIGKVFKPKIVSI